MKKVAEIFFSILFIILFTGFSGSSVPRIKFDTLVYDFGTIPRRSDGTCTFTFTNTGDAPLLITRITAACGSTVPSYSSEPILPGKKGEVNVAYNTRQVGNFRKSITVLTNDPKNPTVVLTITGKVVRQ